MLFWIVATNCEVQTGCCMICCLPRKNLFLSASSLSFVTLFAQNRQVYVHSYQCCLLFLGLPSLHIPFHACDMSGNRENHFYQGGILGTHARTRAHTHIYMNLLAVNQMVIILSFIHSFGTCRMRRFLAVLRSFFDSSLVCTFSCHLSPPTILPSSLTSFCDLFLGLPLKLVVPKFIYNTLLGILFSSTLCTCPNQHNLFNLIVSVQVGFLNLA